MAGPGRIARIEVSLRSNLRGVGQKLSLFWAIPTFQKWKKLGGWNNHFWD